MKFKVKLRKIGNSQGVYIPKNVITNYKIGDEIALEIIDVITLSPKSQDKPQKVITNKQKVITSKPHKKLVFNVKTLVNEWK